MQADCVVAPQATTQACVVVSQAVSQLAGELSVPVADTLFVIQVPQHLPSAATQAAEQVSIGLAPPVLLVLEPPVADRPPVVATCPPVANDPPVAIKLDPPVDC